MGVHRSHRGHGNGTAITLAAAEALRDMGSSGASVRGELQCRRRSYLRLGRLHAVTRGDRSAPRFPVNTATPPTTTPPMPD